MKLSESLAKIEKPTSWSKARYYRARSIRGRILQLNNPEIEVTKFNLDSVLQNLKISVNYRHGGPKHNNRTYKTYISEIKRYMLLNLNETNNGSKKNK